MTFYSDPQLRTIDFDITLSPDETVKFGDTKEGMFAIRLAAPLEEEQPKNIPEPKRTGKLVNAQNKIGEKNVWGKRSEWADYSGQINGEPVGMAIFDHPVEPAASDLLACAGVRPVRDEHFRRARFRERQRATAA